MAPTNLPTRHTAHRIIREPRVAERHPFGLAAGAGADVAAFEALDILADDMATGMAAECSDEFPVHVTSVERRAWLQGEIG